MEKLRTLRTGGFMAGHHTGEDDGLSVPPAPHRLMRIVDPDLDQPDATDPGEDPELPSLVPRGKGTHTSPVARFPRADAPPPEADASVRSAADPTDDGLPVLIASSIGISALLGTLAALAWMWTS